MHDVIVCDEEFEQASSAVSDVCQDLENLMRTYLRLMEGMTKLSTVSGATGDALRAYVNAAKGLKGVLPLLAEQNSLIARDFLRKIDEADRYLF